MDKLIGRPVISICGVVSANNYIEYQELKLVGNFIYIQLRLSKSFVTTFHLEIITSESISLRITASTLYQGDKPRFLGRSLRSLNLTKTWSLNKLNLNLHIAIITLISITDCHYLRWRVGLYSALIWTPYWRNTAVPAKVRRRRCLWSHWRSFKFVTDACLHYLEIFMIFFLIESSVVFNDGFSRSYYQRQRASLGSKGE